MKGLDVPSYARSIQFQTDDEWALLGEYPEHLEVSLKGIGIPLVLYSLGSEVNDGRGPVKTYAGDISAFAGQQNVTLQIGAFGSDRMNRLSFMGNLDEIVFSPLVAPEPSGFIHLGVIAVVLLAYVLRLRRAR